MSKLKIRLLECRQPNIHIKHKRLLHIYNNDRCVFVSASDRPYYLQSNYALGAAGGVAPTLSLNSAPSYAYAPGAPQPQFAIASFGGGYSGNRGAIPTSLSAVPESLDADFESFESTSPPLITSTLQPDSLEDIKAKLPWLNDILTENNTLTSPPGDYILSFDATVTNQTACPETPVNGTAGICTLLPQCPQVFEQLTDAAIFEKYFCALDAYAGICCPTEE